MTHGRSKWEKADIRKEINRLLGGSLKEGEWDDLVSEGYPDEIRRNPDTLDRVMAEAVEKVRHRRSIYGSTHGSTDHKARLLSEQEVRQSFQRSEIISNLVAQEAAQEANVRSFRTEVLGDRYLSLEEIEEWLQQQAQKDGPPTNWLSNIPIARTKAEELMKKMLRINPDMEGLSLEIPIHQVRYLSLQTHFLQYPGLDGWERSMPTALGGVLERLRELSNELAKKYKWANQQATAFILTGRIPLMSPIHTTLRVGSGALSSRIILEIDPALSAAEVARHYRRNRKKIIATRHRNLNEKHMRLAAFGSTKSKKETWAMKMDEWNRTQKSEWKYKFVSNFAHDCIQARNRLFRIYTIDLTD